MVPVETILKQALALPTELRAELVGELLRSLPVPAPAPARESRPDEDTHITWEGAQRFLED